MQRSDFQHTASDGRSLFVHRFTPDGDVRAVLHVVHGVAEHGARYARVAEALAARGYAVYANDHRGHGKTATGDDELGHLEMARIIADVAELMAREKKEHPGRPFVLFGHSMGSYIVQRLMATHGAELQAAVLSGTSGKPTPLAAVGRYVARLERLRLGARGKSALLRSLSFDTFNKQFKPNRTAFDWLSRDAAEVDKYVADKWCGFESTTATWVDLLDLISENAQPDLQSRVPKALPVYLFSGGEDPLSERTKSVEQLIGAYRRAGLTDLTHRFYPGARHETLNELNRDEVTGDLLSWLDARVGRAAPG